MRGEVDRSERRVVDAKESRRDFSFFPAVSPVGSLADGWKDDSVRHSQWKSFSRLQT